MWLRWVALALSIIAVLLLLASGPGVRLGLWHYSSGFLLLRVAAYVGLAAAALALAGLVRRRWRAASLGVALVLGLGAAAGPLEFQRRARSAPRLNDVSEVRVLPLPAAEAFSRASAAARDMGWEVAAADPAAGRIEAVATTFWFGFKDDVTVRVAPQEAGSRVEVRSKSRVGRGDAGTNARRVRDYLKRLE
jgi:hypothetical protein